MPANPDFLKGKPVKFPQSVIDRVVARQGRLHLPRRWPARSLAFVVIDMQNYFLSPEFPSAVPGAAATIPAVNKLCGAVRSAGGMVVWVQTTSENSEAHLPLHYAEALTRERQQYRLKSLGAGSTGYALHSSLDVQSGDARVEKLCYSAMVQGSSTLKETLQQHGVDTILIGGTATNVCCDSTARDAMMQNFRTVMVEDALSSFTLAEHEFALQNWITFFGDVCTVDEAVEGLGPAA